LHATLQVLPYDQLVAKGPNLRDVAERAGVSIRTVSNVVNDFPLVAPHTRERVQRVIDELRYRPNAAARHLRGGHSGIVALVIPEIASPYFSEVAALITRGAEDRSWTVLVEQTDGDPDRERRLLDGLAAQFVDGLIVSPWALSPIDLRSPPVSPPLVLLGEQEGGHLFDHVVIDNVTAAEEITTHLISRGRRRIAAIGHQPHLANGTTQLRLTGFHRALAAAGLPADPALELPVQRLHRADGAAAMRALLEGGRPFDAAFCFTDQLALGALRVALQAGLRVPADLAIAGFDDIEDGRYSTPSLTTVTPDKPAIARHALACLAQRLSAEGAARPARQIVVAHHLSVRESTGG
jgi:DNA-binding LacI/PurR family transcriptional regulator